MEAELKEKLIKEIESDPRVKENLENYLKKFSLLAFKHGNKDGYITQESLINHFKHRKFKNKQEREKLMPVIEESVNSALLALILLNKAIRVEDENDTVRYKFNEKRVVLKEMLLLEKESLLNRLQFIDNELKNF